MGGHDPVQISPMTANHSSSTSGSSEERRVRLERLVIEADQNTFALDLHPRLTVIGGVGRLEREGLVNELVGALAGGRQGVHLELQADNGSRFAVFRPSGSRHRIVEIDTRTDVTEQFADDQGMVNLLARTGLDARTAKAAMRIGSADVLTTSERDHLLQRLAHVNQHELWVAAETLRSAQRRLEDEAEAVGSSAEDAEIIERIEQRHEEHERHRAASERIRKLTFVGSGLCAIAAVPAALKLGLMATVPLLVLALCGVIVSVVSWRRVIASARNEELALTEFGAQSYLGFHIQRVNGLLSSDQARRRLMQAAEEHREALRRWAVIAGDVELDWVLRNRGQIDTAARIRSEVFGGEQTADIGQAERAAGLANTVVSRLSDLRTIGVGGESFVALFDEPFSDLEPAIIPPLLELLVRSSEHQQIVLLTENAAIASWARLEAMTGALALVEPSPEPSTSSEVALWDPSVVHLR